MKKLIYILIFLIIIALGFLGFRWLFPAASAPVVDTITDILPFGSGDGFNIPPRNGGGVDVDGTDGATTPDGLPSEENLFQISSEPVAGAVVLEVADSPVVRYADRATGHIYDYALDTGTRTKVTNTTLPQIYEALFGSSGNSVIYRTLREGTDIVENQILTLTPPVTQGTSTPEGLYTISTRSIAGNLDEIAIGSGNSFFYTQDEPPAIIAGALNNTTVRTISSIPFREWRLTPTNDRLVIYTKASSEASGYAYSLNVSNGAMTKLLGPLDGLVVLPNPTRTKLLYSYADENSGRTRLLVRDVASGEDLELITVTLAEKCVWSRINTDSFFCGTPTSPVGESEPDNWYKGVTHFSDRIRLLYTDTPSTSLFSDPSEDVGVDMDVYLPTLSPEEDYLIFTNKRDLSLWALRLE